ncbi:MAG: UDP-N-acetylmuramoyl-L-alanine--D-glutamate ligase [Candidatus Nanosyncoccaceae bacterium]|jgi:UDP-N-acetylmuramoylalanine--D-glutamate ligase
MPKAIVIAGYGLEGQSAYKYLSRLYPSAKFTIYDQKATPKMPIPKGVELVCGDEVDFGAIKADMTIRTPSISPKRFSSEAHVTSVTNLFFERCPAPIIGVTGTKGKGTTCGLITAILQAAGNTVHLVGNIGKPALDTLNQIKSTDIVVYELSSFQLWDMQYSPKVAVVLMVEPDHLDIHIDQKEYVESKANLPRLQGPGDITVCHPTNKLSNQIAKTSQGKIVHYGVVDDGGAYVKSNNFFVHNQMICPVSDLTIVGQHNVENACAAITAVLSFTSSWPAIARGLKDFTGLPHRLKYLRTLRGVDYYDDNYSTQPEAAIVAVRAITQPKILIAGGHDKGADFTHLADEIQKSGSVKKILLIGDTANKIKTALERVGFTKTEIIQGKNLKEIVVLAQSYATSGDVVLMSPACASFGLFRDATDRGEQFIQAVAELK